MLDQGSLTIKHWVPPGSPWVPLTESPPTHPKAFLAALQTLRITNLTDLAATGLLQVGLGLGDKLMATADG